MKKRHYYYLLCLIALIFAFGHTLASAKVSSQAEKPYLFSGLASASGHLSSPVTDKVKIYYYTSFSHTHDHYAKPEELQTYVINEAPENYEIKAFTVKVLSSNHIKAPKTWENLDPQKGFHKKFNQGYESVPQERFTLFSSYPKGNAYIEISALLFDKKTNQLLDSFSFYQTYPERGASREKDLRTAYLFGHHTRLS